MMEPPVNCSYPHFTDRVIRPVGAESLHLTLAAIGILGNGLVFILFLRLPILRVNTTNIFLFNLAIADFCSSVFLAIRPYAFALNPENIVWNELVCRFFKSDFPLWTCVTASIYNLLLVTFDRYLCVVKPFIYRRYFTVPRIRLMVALCWIFSAILETFCFYSTRVNACGRCEIYWSSVTLQIVCAFGVFFTTYLFPTVVMLFVYGRIVKTLKEREEALKNHQQRAAAASLLRTRRNIVTMLQLLVLMFGLLWAPNQILFLVISFPGVTADIESIGYTILVAVGFLNCVVNPFVYAFKNPKFRKGFITVICCRRGHSISPSDFNGSGGDDSLTVNSNKVTVSVVKQSATVASQNEFAGQLNHVRFEDQMEIQGRPLSVKTDRASDILEE